MTAADILSALCRAIDEHRWDDLPGMLDPEFVCRYVHTGEQFDREQWVRLNGEYPGFERMTVEDVIDGGDRAVARCHVTSRDDAGLNHFEVATFVRSHGNVLVEMTEVWADAAQPHPLLPAPSDGARQCHDLAHDGPNSGREHPLAARDRPADIAHVHWRAASPTGASSSAAMQYMGMHESRCLRYGPASRERANGRGRMPL